MSNVSRMRDLKSHEWNLSYWPLWFGREWMPSMHISSNIYTHTCFLLVRLMSTISPARKRFSKRRFPGNAERWRFCFVILLPASFLVSIRLVSLGSSHDVQANSILFSCIVPNWDLWLQWFVGFLLDHVGTIFDCLKTLTLLKTYTCLFLQYYTILDLWPNTCGNAHTVRHANLLAYLASLFFAAAGVFHQELLECPSGRQTKNDDSDWEGLVQKQ